MTDKHLSQRNDLSIIAEMVKHNAKVLDLGCGNGKFLKELKQKYHARVLGIEICPEYIVGAIANGVPVIQGDLNGKLDFLDDDAFDLAILSHTVQEVKHPDLLLKEMVRVSKQSAVSFINFGHLPCRLQLLFTGRMPQNDDIPYHWYDTPNIHLGTIDDFRSLCDELDIRIIDEIPIGAHPRLTRYWPNLFAAGAVFLLEKK